MQMEFDRHIYRILLASAAATLTAGTIVYHFVEHFSWIDAYYFSVITLATIGYGDLVPHTTFGKLFTTFYVFIGVGIITAFISYSLRRAASKRANRLNRNGSKSKHLP